MTLSLSDLAKVPAELAGEVEHFLAEPQISAALARDTRLRTRISRVVACSPYAASVFLRDPQLLADAQSADRLNRRLQPGELTAMLSMQARDDLSDAQFGEFLRRVRHRELCRVLWRDLWREAALEETLADLSALADALVNIAVQFTWNALTARHGTPRDLNGAPSTFGVLGMGKLGGGELNLSSDIDLVFLYSQPGETEGPRSLSNEEFFTLLARRVIALLAEHTPNGFVYRVDVRLRPFGVSGPLVVSLPALETYLVQNGRDWERYAYIKARVINPWPHTQEVMQQILRPFVYRRYLDYGAFSALRQMKVLVEREVERLELHDQIKLGPGGIREIEFIVQSLQLVRGGTVTELQAASLLTALGRLLRHGYLRPAEAADLDAAYRHLRRVENCLQAVRDQQTHDLPAEPLEKVRIAFAMGYRDWEEFSAELDHHRQRVSAHFRAIVFHGTDAAQAPAILESLTEGWLGRISDPEFLVSLAALGFRDAPNALEPLKGLRSSRAYQRMDEHGRERLDLLMPAVIALAASQERPEFALAGTVEVLAAIGRRSAYFSLLNENPAARERLVKLCGLSGLLARQVAAHPLLLDELLDPRLFSEPPTRVELERDLASRLTRIEGQDAEGWRDGLRDFHQAATFRVAVADLSGILPLIKVSDRLTDTAEIVLNAALARAWSELVAVHGRPYCGPDPSDRAAGFAIIAYGKLGGFELGYGSDLDLVFLHDSTGEDQRTRGAKPLENALFFNRLVSRIISILTLPTRSGSLYDVDTRLRPGGAAGLLVGSLAAFEQYQKSSAWTWEHQALLRSRAVAGSDRVRQAFESLRRRVLTGHIHSQSLAEDVVGMRRKMVAELSHGSAQLFDIKQDWGGITDIEFIVQYLVLEHARDHPCVVEFSDNLRQLQTLVAEKIIDESDARILFDTYRYFRERLHRLALVGERGRVPRAEVSERSAAVEAVWNRVFAAGE